MRHRTHPARATAVAFAGPAARRPVGGCTRFTASVVAASRIELTDKHGAEAVERGAPVPGGTRIGDRGFARAPGLRRFRKQSADQADLIVRVGWNALSLTRQDGSDFDLTTHLGTLPAKVAPHEVTLRAKAGALDPPLPLRLVTQRKISAATKAARRQKVPGPRSLATAEFMILGTSLATKGYPAEEVPMAYRLRRRVERAFKRLKSLLRMDRIPTQTERASRSWLAAHFILALCDGLGQDALASFPRRPVDAAYTPSLWRVWDITRRAADRRHRQHHSRDLL